jgi:predicted permease
MKPIPTWRRYARFFGPDPAADVQDELAFHLAAKTDDLIAQGWKPDAARREAERQFGDMRRVQHAGEKLGQNMQRRRRLSDHWNDGVRDVGYALRKLGREPGFATASILILALAIGANVAVFSVVNTLLLRPLPFPDSGQLVWIAPPPQKCGTSCSTYSADAYDEFVAESRSYQGVTGYEAFTTVDNLRLEGRGEPQPATGMKVIPNFFQVLGVQPATGRLFRPEEGQKGAQPAAMLTDPYWRRQFAADPAIVGKTIDLNGSATVVVGVLPASFDFGAVFAPGTKTDVVLPLIMDDERTWGNIITMMGRLKPGVTLAEAQAEGLMVEPHLCWSKRYPQSCGGYVGKDTSMLLRTLKDYVSGKLRRSLIVLWSAVGVILLIACVNLSNLLLARAFARSKEFAVRGALGASRGRIVRQLLIESLVLSAASAMLGLALAWTVIQWLAHQGSLALPLLGTLHLDGQALAWTLLVAVSAAILFGLAPGLRIASGNLQESLKDSGPAAGLGRKHDRLRAALVVSEVALACVLLVGAGLLLRSFLRVLDIDLGFQPDRTASMKVEYDDSAATNDQTVEKRSAIFQQVLAAVKALPGVEEAGMVDFLPLGQNRAWGVLVPKGKTYPAGAVPSPLVYVVTPGFVHAMGIRLHGRDFTWADGPKSQRVVLINQSAARFYWPHEDAVGKILTNGPGELTVVGVVDDVHEESLEGEAGWQVYYPATQATPDAAQLVVRSSLPPSELGSSVLHALRALNPRQPAAEFRPMRTIVDRAGSPRRFFMLLVAGFAGLGLLLAALGIYGVISYSVTKQTGEIGVRMALGASTTRVRRGVLLGTLRLALTGIFAGTLASIAVAKLIASLLFGTSPWDGATYSGVVVALVTVAVLSGYLPARRASLIDPMTALRSNG